jgi:ABC-type multidrug transport system fused ATPase/permease subunit
MSGEPVRPEVTEPGSGRRPSGTDAQTPHWLVPLRDLRAFLPVHGRRSSLLLVGESLVGAVLEALLLVMVVGAALAVSEARSSVPFDAPFFPPAEPSVIATLAMAAAAGVAMLLLHLHTAKLMADLAGGVIQNVRLSVVSAFSRATWSRQSADREGALQETVSSLSTQTSSLVLALCQLVCSLLGLVSLLLIAFIVNAVVTFVVMAFGVVLFLVLRPVGRLTRSRATAHVASNVAFTEGIGQWSSMAMELRVFGVEDAQLGRVARSNDEAAATFSRLRFASRVGSDIFRDIVLVFLVGAIAALRFIPDLDLAAVGAVVLLVIRSLAYAQGVNASGQSVNELRPNFETLLHRLRSLQSAQEWTGGVPLDEVRSIELAAVSYEYGLGRPGVHDVSLRIERGEVLGVVGPSGGGKTTLVQVLLRLRTPTAGTVTISGIPYEQIDTRSWRRLVSLVPQEPRLFEGTIAENIAFFREGVSRDRVREAAEIAHVISDIERLPMGFDTTLGPRGVGLSGGQKQRIAIARALLGDPQLLVLDEPTSALDVASEEALQQTIADLKGRMTFVVVAHRLTTLAWCDRVVAIAGGGVQMVGSLGDALAAVSFDAG